MPLVLSVKWKFILSLNSIFWIESPDLSVTNYFREEICAKIIFPRHILGLRTNEQCGIYMELSIVFERIHFIDILC